MDQRQTQIKEQAGLTESRLNQDFIDSVKRWGPTVLAIVAIVAIVWTGYHRWQRAKAAEVDAAFRELTAATMTANPSPESLRGIAQTYRSVRGVAPMALLQAGDAYLRAVRLGMKVGTTPQPDGSIASADLITESDRASYLSEAQALYQRVLDATGATPGKEIHAIAAAYGLAAVHESRGEMDRAKAMYDRVIQLADRAGFAAQIDVARRRAEALTGLATPPRLFNRAELPGATPVATPEVSAPAAATAEPSAAPSGDAAPSGEATETPKAGPAEPTAPAAPKTEPEPAPAAAPGPPK